MTEQDMHDIRARWDKAKPGCYGYLTDIPNKARDDVYALLAHIDDLERQVRELKECNRIIEDTVRIQQEHIADLENRSE